MHYPRLALQPFEWHVRLAWLEARSRTPQAKNRGHDDRRALARVERLWRMCRCPHARRTWLRSTDSRIRANSSFGDNAVMILLVAQLVLGLATIPLALGHLDGSEMLKFMAWAQGLMTFQAGAAAHLADVHPIFKLHILLGLGLFVAVPFTRLVHVGSAPLRYLWRPGYQIVRSRRGAKPVHPLAPFTAPITAGRPSAVPQAHPVPQRQAAE